MKDNITRCVWASDDELYQKYHDTEWGRPTHDDHKLFEMLILEGMQAGLSWITILRKRDNFRKAFDNFDIDKILKYDEKKIETLLRDEGIIRNQLKINSVIVNAKAFRDIQNEYGSFNTFIWSFVNNKPIKNTWNHLQEMPATSDISDKISDALKKRGFKFVGSTIIYAYMQAIGLVNDHAIDCFLHHELLK